MQNTDLSAYLRKLSFCSNAIHRSLSLLTWSWALVPTLSTALSCTRRIQLLYFLQTFSHLQRCPVNKQILDAFIYGDSALLYLLDLCERSSILYVVLYECEIKPLTLRKEQIWVWENRAPKKIFGPQIVEVTRTWKRNCIMKCFITLTIHHILLEWSEEEYETGMTCSMHEN
jgi:hypothetical protein